MNDRAMLTLSRRLALLGCSSLALLRSGMAVAAADGTLRRGNRYEPASLDPHKINTTYEMAIVSDLFEGLVAYGPEGQPGPGLAESWTVTPDGKRYTFRLRPRLTWSDGAPLTADDVVFSFRRLMDPKTAAPFAALLYVLKSGRAVNTGAAAVEALGVSAPDAATVILDLDAPAAYLPQILANAYAGIIPRHVVAQKGDDWIQPGNAVASGAFMLESWRPHEDVTLVQNPRYHDAAAVKLARVIYLPTEDLTSGLARFRAGELDTQIDVPLAQLDRLRTDLPVETRLSQTLLTYYLAVNTSVVKLADQRVRRALSLAIDRDVLTTKVLRGGEQPAFSFVPPTVAGYQPAFADFADKSSDARLAEANQLLSAAGYGLGKTLQVTYNHSSNLDLRRIAVIIASMWKRVGIETTLINTEGKVHFANMRQGNFDIAFAGWQADFNDASSFLYVLDSASTRSNYARYHNPAYDSLLAQAAAMENAGARADLLHKAEEQLMRDQPVIPLYYGVTKNMVSQRVVGWRANAIDTHLSRYLSVVK